MTFCLITLWQPAYFAVGLVTISLFMFIYLRFFYIDIPAIQGLPEIPQKDVLAGHLYRLGDDHAKTAEDWALHYHWPVYQIRMGHRRAVVLNSFEAAREWIIKNQSSTLDRPWFYTFHGVVSATSAATIGTSPWNERTKKQRRIVGSLTTGPSIQRLSKLLDLESAAMISTLYYDSEKGTREIMPHIYEKRVSLNIMTMFCYGTRFTSIADPMFLQILSDASTIASFRSTKSNPQDFIPYLRYLPKSARTSTAVEVRNRRDKWLAALLDKVRRRVFVNVGARKSVAELLLTDNQEGLTTRKFSLLYFLFSSLFPVPFSLSSLLTPLSEDIRTILGGLMSGGFETIFSTAIITTGVLATPEGQEMQRRAYNDILAVYGTPEQAFKCSVSDEKSTYVVALVKEALRFYPPLKLLPARQIFKEFIYKGSVIPKGVLVYINAQAINRGKLSSLTLAIFHLANLSFSRQSHLWRRCRQVQA